jgi:folate-binding protein YgfZ
VLDEVAPLAAGSWASAPAWSATPVLGATWPAGSLCIARSLTGDAGFMIGLPADAPGLHDVEASLQAAASRASLVCPLEPELSALMEVLRIEAGVVRIGPDTLGRKRVLPETGLEQQAVSYTKGCYLGQEVIARVRTYGALPFSLRGLVFEDAQQDVLDRLPEAGGDVAVDGGKAVGQLASRSFSPVLDAPVAFAYLDKKHRTPGEELAFRGKDGSTLTARIALLPFYSAPDSAERVAWLYDRGVRLFAGGRSDEALGLLEEALRLDSSFSDGYEAIGVMLGREERFHEAIDIFKRLEEIAPHEPMVNTNLSLYFMKIGDKETAEDHAAKAMQKSMARSAGREVDGEALDAVMAEQKRADALRKKAMFAQVLEIDAEDDVALFGLGNALAVLGELEEAADLYARAAAVERDNSAVYLAHGKVLEQLGRDDEAESVYRAGMEVASRKGDLMPLKEMEHRILLLGGGAATGVDRAAL